MAITYPVPVESRWTIVHVPTENVIARDRPWPRADGGEIQGADPDYAYLLQEDLGQPDYDSRLYFVEREEVLDIPNNKARRSWVAVKRPLEERKQAVLNEESYQLNRHLEMGQFISDVALSLGILTSIVLDGAEVPAGAKAITQRIKAASVKLQQNRDRRDAILAELETGDPDLDAGWAKPELVDSDGGG